jgi:hypothetical protein
MKEIVGSLIRHALSALGATEYVGGDNVQQAAGAILFLASLGWSVWQKYRAKKSPAAVVSAPAITLFVGLLLGAAAFSGCATKLSPNGPYAGDTVLYNADKAIVESYDTLHLFVKWEWQNRETLSKWPEIKQGADYVRQNAERWISSATGLRDAYAAAPSSESRAALEKSLGVLRTALAEASNYMKKGGTSKQQLRALDLTRDPGSIGVSSSLTDHPADMLGRSSRRLCSGFRASQTRSTTV